MTARDLDAPVRPAKRKNDVGIIAIEHEIAGRDSLMVADSKSNDWILTCASRELSRAYFPADFQRGRLQPRGRANASPGFFYVENARSIRISWKSCQGLELVVPPACGMQAEATEDNGR
jgi:hypothetical protein